MQSCMQEVEIQRLHPGVLCGNGYEGHCQGVRAHADQGANGS